MPDSPADRPAAVPIAVVGIGCRFPGGHGTAQFWSSLTAGRDAISEVPPERFDVDAYYVPGPHRPGRINTRYGGFLDRIDTFDAGFFGISPKEAAQMDPQQRLLLETTHEAFEDAGIAVDTLAGTRTGVFVGQLTAEYWDLLNRDGDLDIYANAGTTRSITSGRLSYVFDLHGPSMTVDTACSSSLTAVHLAVQSLRAGESDIALAGATNLVLEPWPAITFCQADMLAPDGRCKFASPAADGFIRSDGVAAVVLKTLERAEADGDEIYSIILGSAVTSDGQGSGFLLTPSVDGQERALRLAYDDAGVDPATVGYVEAHGTGTPVGDRVELTALNAVLGPGRDTPCLVGSVKTNIGHTEATAGLAGLIKAALCLKHRLIPASLHAEELTTSVPWDEMPFVVPRELTDWDQDEAAGPRVAGVSSFGISGTNAHIVLAEYVPVDAVTGADGTDDAPVLLPLSAMGTTALREAAADMAEFLADGGPGRALPLRDIAATAAVRRRHLYSRLTVVGTSHDELAVALRAFAEDEETVGDLRVADDVVDRPVRTVFVFPGQGSQWVGMGRELLATSEVFRAALTECDAAVRAETGWSVLDRIADDAPLADIDVVQPMLWAMEVALAALWRSWGVEPDAVIGHSMGEAAAACVAGALSVADAAAVICRRSRLLKQVSGQGAMAYVELTAEEAERELADYADRVSVAVVNAPNSTVIAGDPQALEEILATLKARDVFGQPVKVDVASHSPQMDPLNDPLIEALSDLAPRPGAVTLHSTVLDEVVDGSQLDAHYWALNLREPVRFGAAVGGRLALGRTLFIEMSPHPILVPAVRQCLAAAGADAGLVVPSLRRDEPERATLLDAVATAHLAGVPIDWRRVYGSAADRFVRLPTYPWQGSSHWYRPQDRPVPVAARRHPLLGPRRPGGGSDLVWEGPLDLAANDYLLDHQVQGTALLPGTAYVELMTVAAREAFAPARPALTGLTCHRAMFLRPGDELTVRVRITDDGSAGYGIEVASAAPGEPMIVHATARVLTGAADAPAPESATVIRARCPEHWSGRDFYDQSELTGNAWGPRFQGIAELWRGDGEALARVETPAGLDVTADPHAFHPALLDATAQLVSATAHGTGSVSAAKVFVLEGMDEVRVFGSPRGTLWSHAVRTSPPDGDSYCGDLTVTDDDGTVLAALRGVRLHYLEPEDARPAATTGPADTAEIRDDSDWMYELDWRPVPARPGAAATGGPWLVFADRAGIGAELARGLRAAGHRCVLVNPGGGYLQPGPDTYVMDPGSADDHRRLLAALGGAEPWRVVHLWSLDEDRPDPARGALHLIRALTALRPSTAGLWLVTRGAQKATASDRVQAPAAAAVWAMGRTVAREQPGWRCVLVDLATGDGPEAAGALLGELTDAGAEEQVALRGGGIRLAARLVRRPWSAPAPGVRPRTDPRPVQMFVDTPGALDGLRFTPVSRPAPAPGEVEIEVGHVALNYRDVLWSLGVLPDSAGARLGLESTGTVSAVGDGVTSVAVGDRVLALTEGAMSTYHRVPAPLVHRIPAGLSTEEAVTLPAAFVTAYYSLCHVASLREGDRVLIHSATGGVGLAAVQVARWKKLEIHATAGSPERRALLRTFGIRHVADSRSLDFVDMVREATNGEGVHAVLNTLTGADAISANLSLLAPHGTYLELTKRDLNERSPIDLRPLINNLSFSVVDVLEMFRKEPEVVGRLLRDILRLIGSGDLSPLPYRVFPAERMADACREMARARHVGKVVVALGAPVEEESGRQPGAGVDVPVRAGATYVVSGGLGGLGLVTAHWLVDRGADELLLLGRSAPPSDGSPDPRLQALRRRGVRAEYAALDIADESALRRVLADRAAAGRPPVRGVVHAAGVVAFTSLDETTDDELSAALRPKLDGAMALHNALDGAGAGSGAAAAEPLDFFVLFSSGSAIFASPMLGAYAAGNAALDGFAHWRRQAGLHALSVNWGFWAEAGLAAEFGRRQGRSMAPAGIGTFSPAEGIRILERLLVEDATQAMVMPADWERWGAMYPEAATSSLLRELLVPAARPEPVPAPAPAPAPVPVPASVPASVPVSGDLGGYLAGRVAEVLGLPLEQVSRSRPLNRQGMDSLMAVAVRTRVQEETGVTLSMAKMLGGRTITELAAELEAAVDQDSLAGARS
ncbi:type I polyketide synthase [Streptomyces cylindrosporus]|uniref:Type I polyketide synthase n=1 Tax=Streptomyces cylindrosporus TaxID=2927583 RepID=A0ABS9YES1_9ACTN|nr:type I polyketide synthase [Streptomyces cylindrosporus]MCI3275035.1 type I polyketide synthase [Streptomyces cylindrosporus]